MLHATQTEPSKSVSKRGSVCFNGTGREMEGREARRFDYSRSRKDPLSVPENALHQRGNECG